MNITVSIRNVYGNETIYPVCDKAKAFAALAGTKTLTRAALEHVRALGYSINVQQPQPLTL
jgi:hypothetical protein